MCYHAVTRDIDHSLSGATFSLETVRIARSSIHPLGLMNDQEHDGSSCDDELQLLTKVNKKHAALSQAVMRHKSVKVRHQLLRASQQLLQTTTARVGDDSVQLLLEQGSIGNMAHDED